MSRKYYIIVYVIIKGWILEVEALVVPSDYTCFVLNGYSLLRIGNSCNPYICFVLNGYSLLRIGNSCNPYI